LCVGQVHDVQNEKKKTVTLKKYMQVLNDKTAELISCAMYIGASIGGGSNNLIENLEIYGINYGLAFQLKDDLLDLENNTGKPLGTDLKNKLPTIISILINESDNQKLKRKIQSKTIKYKNIKRLSKKIKLSKEYSKAIEILNKYIKNANDSLKNIKDSDYKKMLIKSTYKLSIR
jgi:geranylgeranyl pyrophosphate synthase